MENARITVTGADLNVAAPKSYALYFNDRAMADAVREVFGRPLRVKFTADEAGRARRRAAADAAPPPRKAKTKSPPARWPTPRSSASAKCSAAKSAKFETSRSSHVKLPGNMQRCSR